MIQASRSQFNQDATVFTVKKESKISRKKREGNSSDSMWLLEILFVAFKVSQVSLEESSIKTEKKAIWSSRLEGLKSPKKKNLRFWFSKTTWKKSKLFLISFVSSKTSMAVHIMQIISIYLPKNL